MPVDYRMLAETPFIDINAIGNALAVRQHLQDQPMRQMQAAAELERAKLQNRILFMEESQRAQAEKARQANVEELLNMGANGPQAAAGAANIPPPQNALAGMGGAPTAAPAPPGGGGAPMVGPAPVAPPAPPARVPYSPEAEGRYLAQEGKRVQAMKEAKDTFSMLLKAAVETGSQDMVDSLLRAGKKSPVLASMVAGVGDPDGPEGQRLRVVGKGEAETESTFSKEQLEALAKNAGSDVVRKAIEDAKPGAYAIKTKGDRVIGFKPSTGATKPLSDIGKLEHDRDLKVDALVAAGKYKTRDEAFEDPEVKAYQDEIKKKSQPTGAYPIGHVQSFQVGRNVVYKEYEGDGKWKERKDLGGGPKDLPPQFADDFKVWDKETKLWHFENFKSTGVKPDFGWGKDAGRSRAQFQREYADWNIGKGVSGAEAGAAGAEYKAKSMSVRNQEKIRGMMGGFVRNMDKQIVRVDSLFDKIVQRVGVRALDWPLREMKTRAIGSGAEAIIEAYLLEISNEIGKLSTGSAASIQELSKEAQVKWARIHDPNLSPREIKKILTETRHMGKLRLDSADEEIKKTLNDMKNIGKEAEVKPGDGKVVPRKPGESVADYLRRTSK